MQMIYFYVSILYFILAQSIFAQQIDKVIISGYGGQHDLDVESSFLIGYASYNNTPFPGKVILFSNSLQTSFNYAVVNDYDLIIRSTSGLSTGLRLAPSYPTVKLVMPSGSNNFVQSFFGDVITSPVVITGAGIDSNITGYTLEFYSIDPITPYNYSSYSNGYIAGQLAFIANTLNISFDSTRVLARVHGSESGVLDFYNGFGKVLPQNIITNPLPVELTSFTAKVFGSSILLNWQTSTEINNYGFEVERNTLINPLSRRETEGSGVWQKIGFVIGNGNSNSPKSYSFADDKVSSGEYSYRLKQIDNDGQFKYSDIVSAFYSLTDFQLFQNYPNPFNPSTTISWQAPVDGIVSIKIYDILGNKIAELINEFKPAGRQEIKLETASVNNGLTSGVYIYQIEIRNNELLYTMSNKMILLK